MSSSLIFDCPLQRIDHITVSPSLCCSHRTALPAIFVLLEQWVCLFILDQMYDSVIQVAFRRRNQALVLVKAFAGKAQILDDFGVSVPSRQIDGRNSSNSALLVHVASHRHHSFKDFQLS
jgi:hypothetical protein